MIKYNLCCPNTLCTCGFPLWSGWLPRDYTRREDFSTSPGGNWFPIASRLGGEISLPPPLSMLRFDLAWTCTRCACCHKHDELTHACSRPALSRSPDDAVALRSPLPLVLTVFPPCLPQWPSRFWKSGCNKYVSYRAELSVAFYLCTLATCGSGC